MKDIPPIIAASGAGWSITSHPEFSPPRFGIRLSGVRVVWAYSLSGAERRLCKLLVDRARCQVKQSQALTPSLPW